MGKYCLKCVTLRFGLAQGAILRNCDMNQNLENKMDWLIIPGIIITCIGLTLLLYTIIRVWGAKRQGLSDADMRAQLQTAITWNLGAMGCSGLGLMIIAVGVLL